MISPQCFISFDPTVGKTQTKHLNNVIALLLQTTAVQALSDVRVQVFFSELKYTYIKSEEGYTILALLCDIGGALGLILGSTMLTFCEFSDFIFSLTVAWLRVRATTDVFVNRR